MWWHFKLQLMNNFVLIFSLELGKNRCLKRKFSKLQGRKINRVWNTSNSNKPRRKQSIEIGNIYVNRFSLLCKKIIGCLLLETFHLSSPHWANFLLKTTRWIAPHEYHKLHDLQCCNSAVHVEEGRKHFVIR